MTRRAIEKFRPKLTVRSQSPHAGVSTAAEPQPAAVNAIASNATDASAEPDTAAMAAAASTVEAAIAPQPEPDLAAGDLPAGDLPAACLTSDLTSQAGEAGLPSQAAWLPYLRQQLARGARVLGAPLVWLGIAAFCGGTGYAAFQWLSTIPPIPECDRIWFFSLDSDKLFCAEQAVRSGKPEALIAGIQLTEQWGDSHHLAAKASQLRREWSKQLTQLASQKALANDLNAAIQLAATIQPGNPLYREAKNSILEWEKLRDREHLVANTVEAALKVQDWQKAEIELQPRSSKISDYQRQRLNRLKERLLTERMAFNQLQQIQELVQAKPNDAATLGRATQLAAQINPTSYAKAAAQRDLQRWSQTLVELARQQLINGDIAGAIAVAQWIPAHLSLTTEVQDLVWVSHAQQAPTPPSGRLLVPAHLWQQITTLAALQQIQPASPLYPVAQATETKLEQQVQDLTQLAFAKAIAHIPQVPALEVAIQMAQTLTLERPHRLEAQTLIAEWRQDIQRVQDFPVLMQARKLAKPDKIKDLQAAIAAASKIPLGRALRPTAQAAMFDWQQQIQVIEDKPTLNQARQLAKQNQLAPAIAKASKIAPGRALHIEAQDAIRAWTKTLQAAEDRPILEEAKALAQQGNYGAAIDIAYQIAPGRALYDEAQTTIAQWHKQIATVSRSRRWDDEYRTDPTASQSRDRSFYSDDF